MIAHDFRTVPMLYVRCALVRGLRESTPYLLLASFLSSCASLCNNDDDDNCGSVKERTRFSAAHVGSKASVGVGERA